VSCLSCSAAPSGHTELHPIANMRIGIAVRLWQLGLEMRPLFARNKLWVYPLYATVGGTFGYWLQGLETTQNKLLNEKRENLLAKRKRQAEREAAASREGGALTNGSTTAMS
jgi:hypothetical protein